jgi:MFS family permease
VTGVPWPRRGYAWYVVIVLTVAYAFAILDRVAIGLLVQPIEADLKISDSELGLLQGFAFGIFYSLFGLPIGFLLDRIRRTKLLAMGIVLWSIATMTGGFARSFGMLFLSRVGVGVGEATVSPGASSIIADYFPLDARPKAYGVFMIGATLGSGMAFILGGVAIDAAEWLRMTKPEWFGEIADWKIVFFLIGAPGLMVAAILTLTVREPVRRERLNSKSLLSLYPVYRILKENARAYVGLMGGAVLNLTCTYSLLAWFPTLFIRIHGWTAQEIGGAMGTIGVPIGIFSALSSGIAISWLAKRGRTDAPLLVAAVHSLSLAILGSATCLVSSPPLALVFYAAMAIPTNWSTAGVLTGLNQITPNEFRGQVVAIHTMIVGLVSLGAGSFIVGFLTDHIFGGGKGVGLSLATVFAVCGTLGFAVLSWGRPAFRLATKRALEWIEVELPQKQ